MKTAKKHDELVSVIVPVFNVAEYLEQCLKSIINQTYRKIEIILIDDGSTDESGNICDSFSKNDKRIIVIHKKHGGLSNARNYGLNICRGNYVMFVDSDDYLEPNAIGLLVDNAKNTRADIVICDYYLTFRDKDIKNVYSKNVFVISGNDKYKYISDPDTHKQYGVVSVVQWNKLFNSTIFKTLRFKEGKAHEDEFIIADEFANAKTISFLLKPLYHYRQRGDSITHSFSTKRFDAIDALNERALFFKNNGLQQFIMPLKLLKTNYLLSIRKHYRTEIKQDRRAQSVFNEYLEESKADVKELLKSPQPTKTKVKLNMFLHCRPLLFFIQRTKAVLRREK